MAFVAACFHGSEPLRDMALVGKPTSTVIGFIALPSDFWRLAKMRHKLPPFALLRHMYCIPVFY